MEDKAIVKSLRIKLTDYFEVKDTTIINPGQLKSLKLINICLERGVPILMEDESGKVTHKLVKEEEDYKIYPVG